MKTRLHTLAACLVFAACGDSSGPEIETVTITAPRDEITVGEVLQFTAVATDAAGAVVSGQEVEWSTNRVDIATVAVDGIVTGVGPGIAVITAVVGGVPGTAALTVNPNTCVGGITVALEPGEHSVHAPEDCLILPSGDLLDRYRVMLVRTMREGEADDVVTGALKATALGVAGASPMRARQADVRAGFPAGPIGPIDERMRRRFEVTARAHADIRRQDDELSRSLGTGGIVPSRPLPGPSRAVSPDTVEFYVGLSGCSVSDTSTAVLVTENVDFAVYQDVDQRATRPVVVQAADSMVNFYTTYGRSIIDSYFGPSPDIDGNGKIVVLAHPIVVGDTSGFVTSRDFRSKADCAGSNEKELIYINADLIDTVNDAAAIDIYVALETLVHEAQHVTSLYKRLTSGTGFHPLWIEEGRAEVAGEMASRKAWAAGGGPTPNQRADADHLLADGRINARNFGVVLMVARTILWTSSRPNGMMVTPDGAEDGADVYASGWHFNRWLGDAYGMAGSGEAYADSSFFRTLTDPATAAGIPGIEAMTGKPYETLIKEFMAAIGTHRSGTEAVRPFRTYDFVDLTSLALLEEQPPGTYPYPVTGNGFAPFASNTYSALIGAGGFLVHGFESDGSGFGLQLEPALDAPASVVVVRLR